MSFAAIKYVVNFLANYAKVNAISLPGCIPGYKRKDIKLLPSNRSKVVRHLLAYTVKITYTLCTHKIWDYYIECCQSTSIHAAAKTTFLYYWRTLAPEIRVGKPMSDLCWTCQQNNALILKSVNIPANEKTPVSYTSNNTYHA